MSSEKKWFKLDNAGKLFPSACSKTDTKVFRFSCVLEDDIIPEKLQSALDTTFESFPLFKYIIEKGAFWYYLEKSDLRPIVREEYKSICSAIYNENMENLLFEVTYYKKRINLEIFHSLADGTGALHFLRTLVINYLSYVNNIPIKPEWFQTSSDFQKSSDSFQKYYSSKKFSNEKKKKIGKAYQFKGFRYSDYQLKLINGVMPVKSVLDKAHEYNVTLTVFLVSCLIFAIGEELPERKKKRPVVISVPVNLRNYFKSETSRNFFGTININYNFSTGSGEFEDILLTVKDEFKKYLTVENLSDKINSYSKIEHNAFAKIAPLFFKDICIKAAHDISAMEVTSSFSNVGPVKMPEILQAYVDRFDICTATNKISLCMCSYMDVISISFTSPFMNSDVQRNFFCNLSEMGIDVEISTNPLESREE